MFSEDILKLCEDGGLFIGSMIGAAAFFYCIYHGMAGGIYCAVYGKPAQQGIWYLSASGCIGQTSGRYVYPGKPDSWRNCLCSGAASGGCFFQQVLTSMFMGTMDKAYHLKAEISIWNILLTLGIYLVIFWIALLRAGRRLKKLNIRELMNAERANEEIRQKHISEKNVSFSYGCDLYSDFYASFMEQQNQQCKWNSSVPGTFLVPYIFCTQELQQLCAGMQTKAGERSTRAPMYF